MVFRLFGIRIQVHFTHFIFSALMAYNFSHFRAAGSGWPQNVLSNDNHTQHTFTTMLFFVAWMAFLSLASLMQQLGVALAAKRLDLSPSVRLWGMTGTTIAPGSEDLVWHQQIIFHGAGPLAILALGVGFGSFGVLFQFIHLQPLAYLGLSFLMACLVWTGISLLPFAALPGGQMLTALATQVFGRTGFLLAQAVSLLLSAALVSLSIVQRNPIWALFGVLMSLRAFGLLQAFRRGDEPRGESQLPELKVVGRAETLFHEGKPAEAELVLSDLKPQTAQGRERVERLMGLLALQEGRGQEALDRFRKCTRVGVPNMAKATALGLVGKDDSALPFWEKASAEHPDSAAVYELGGCLIRLGREHEARRLEGIRVAMAYLAAERVHSFRGEFELAAQASEAAFQLELHPKVAFHAACAWARAGKPNSAMRMLVLAGQNGFQDAHLAASTPHLEALHEMREFHQWLDNLRRTPLS
jgi:hypothetical protein